MHGSIHVDIKYPKPVSGYFIYDGSKGCQGREVQPSFM